jgi:hypothetical protein
MPSHPIDIIDFGIDAHVFRSDAFRRSAASPLIVIDQTSVARQAIHLGQEISMIEVGSSMQHQHRHARAHLAKIQARARHGDVALA